MHVFFGAVILACLGWVTLMVLLYAQVAEEPIPEPERAVEETAVRIIPMPPYDWSREDVGGSHEWWARWFHAEARPEPDLLIVDDPITDRSPPDRAAIDAWWQGVKDRVPHGRVLVAEPIEPESPEDWFNRADPHCELCDGIGRVVGRVDPLLYVPCPCTTFGTPDEDSRAARDLRYNETH